MVAGLYLTDSLQRVVFLLVMNAQLIMGKLLEKRYNARIMKSANQLQKFKKPKK